MVEVTDSGQPSRVLPVSGNARMRWKNGAGWTSEILRVPDGEDWQWRLSIAEIESDAPFSTFPGVQRELVLLSGNGLRLRFDDGDTHELLPPHARLRFAGERTAFGELIDGPTRNFNLMWQRDVVDARLWHRPLVGTMVVFVDAAETWVAHVIAGNARFACESGLGDLQVGDSAVLEGSGERRRFVLEGGGEVLLVRVRHLALD